LKRNHQLQTIRYALCCSVLALPLAVGAQELPSTPPEMTAFSSCDRVLADKTE